MKEGQFHYFLIKILAYSFTIKYYIVTENIFLVIAFNLVALHKYLKDILVIALKLIANR